MARRRTHLIIGTTSGAATAAYAARTQQPGAELVLETKITELTNRVEEKKMQLAKLEKSRR